MELFEALVLTLTLSCSDPVSPINCHYTRIYSAAARHADTELAELRDPVSSDSDYDTIYSGREDSGTLLPIGEILGYHRSISAIYISAISSTPAYDCSALVAPSEKCISIPVRDIQIHHGFTFAVCLLTT